MLDPPAPSISPQTPPNPHGPGFIKVLLADSSPIHAPVIPHGHGYVASLVKPMDLLALHRVLHQGVLDHPHLRYCCSRLPIWMGQDSSRLFQQTQVHTCFLTTCTLLEIFLQTPPDLHGPASLKVVSTDSSPIHAPQPLASLISPQTPPNAHGPGFVKVVLTDLSPIHAPQPLISLALLQMPPNPHGPDSSRLFQWTRVPYMLLDHSHL